MGMSMALAMLIANPVILGATPTAPPPSIPAGDVLQGDSDRHARMTIAVSVHGIGPYRFLIDTGSQRTVLSTALAGTLGLVQGPHVRVIGVAGGHSVATAQVDTIVIGPHAFYDLTVPLLERTDIGADGILGTDSLQYQRILLDFARNSLTISDPSEPIGKHGFEIVVRAKKRSGRLILTNALIDGVRTDVVIDTGASGTIGNRALQRVLARKNRQVPMRGSVSSVTGQELAVDITLAGSLRLAGLDIANVLIAYADAPAFRELKLDRSPAILLGMRELRAFKRIAIDFPSRKVSFDLIGTDEL